MRPITSLSAATFLLVSLSAWNSPSEMTPPPIDRQLGHALLKELVELDTTHKRGSTTAAKAIERRLLDAGFAAGEVLVIAPPDHPDKANTLVRMRGSGRARPVLFLGHLDVVEAQAEDWSFDPFQLTEKEGWYYGRGTLDMKSGDAAMLEALIRLRREGFAPRRDLIVAFTADEEAGGEANGPAFLLEQHPELIAAEFAINLDGGGGALRNGIRTYYRIGTSEKIYVTYTLQTTSPGGHGSLPGPDNAIYRLAAGLLRLESFTFPVMMTATTRASFEKLAALGSGPEASDMRAVTRVPPDPDAAARLSQTIRYNAQLRTTCVVTLVSGGHAENALPQRARATVQCRMIPGDTALGVQRTLTHVIDDPKISVTLDAPPIVSPESPPGAPPLVTAEKVIHSMWPGVPIMPAMAAGFSDGRQTRSAGIPTYDLSGIWSDVNENRAHGRDERISVLAFDESLEYTYRLMRGMGRAD